MSTFYRDASFIQVVGSTTFGLGAPLARISQTLADANFFSLPWRLYANGRFLIELDAVDRGGGVLAVNPVVVQRTSLPNAYRYPLGTGVIWSNVPTAEMGFIAVAGGNVQVQEFQGSASYVYRLSLTAAAITAAGDLWVGVTVPSRFSD